MKKVFVIASVGMLMFATSCKKDYTCECTVDILGFTSTASTTLNATKKDAKTACEADNTTGVVCKIK